MWYYTVIGKERCPITDTWWQTETGGHLIAGIPGAMPMKPGSAAMPFFGVDPVILRQDETEAAVNEGGHLCLRKPWPGFMRTVYGDPGRFKEQYFIQHPGLYFSGDGARKDEDGFYWLMGRVDDVINVSGHRLGTAEIESALVSHPSVAESAVVGYPHDIKGQGIYAFVTLKTGFEAFRRPEEGTGQPHPEGDRPDRQSRQAALHGRPPQDPERQDHAPDPQEDRGGGDQ